MSTIRHRRLVCALALLLGFALARDAAAQLTIRVAPDPATAGHTFLLGFAADPPYALVFPDGCIVDEVRAERREGPLVWLAEVCTDEVIPLPEGEALTVPWAPVSQQGVPLSVGTYWLRVGYRIEGTPGILDAWAEVEVDGGDPLLRTHAGARIGATAVLGIEAPAFAGALYVAAASGSLAVDALPEGLRLVPDALFELSLSAPHLFTSFAGNLDVFGEAPALGIAIPAIPALAGVVFHVQAVVGLPGTTTHPMRFTNVQTLVIEHVE